MSAQVWQRRFQWRQRTAHAMHSGTGFKFCKCGIDKERGDSDMRIDATVAGSDAPRRKMPRAVFVAARSEEHTSELQSLMRISYAVFCLKKKNMNRQNTMKTAR